MVQVTLARIGSKQSVLPPLSNKMWGAGVEELLKWDPEKSEPEDAVWRIYEAMSKVSHSDQEFPAE